MNAVYFAHSEDVLFLNMVRILYSARNSRPELQKRNPRQD
jgi:hypothetical protein